MKNMLYMVVIFFTQKNYKYKIANIVFCYKSSLTKESNCKRAPPNCMNSKIKTCSGSMKSKVVNIHKEKTKELEKKNFEKRNHR